VKKNCCEQRFQRKSPGVAKAAGEILEAGQSPGVTETTLVQQSESSVQKADSQSATPAPPSGDLAAPLPPVPKKAATEVVHRVKKGENLHIIAEKYGTNVTSIVRRNALNPRKPLYVDLRLKIPSPAGEGVEEPQPRVSSNGKRAETEVRLDEDMGSYAAKPTSVYGGSCGPCPVREAGRGGHRVKKGDLYIAEYGE
jgi:LysM repeat protein